jgi:hypothetical protein
MTIFHTKRLAALVLAALVALPHLGFAQAPVKSAPVAIS